MKNLIFNIEMVKQNFKNSKKEDSQINKVIGVINKISEKYETREIKEGKRFNTYELSVKNINKEEIIKIIKKYDINTIFLPDIKNHNNLINYIQKYNNNLEKIKPIKDKKSILIVTENLSSLNPIILQNDFISNDDKIKKDLIEYYTDKIENIIKNVEKHKKRIGSKMNSTINNIVITNDILSKISKKMYDIYDDEKIHQILYHHDQIKKQDNVKVIPKHKTQFFKLQNIRKTKNKTLLLDYALLEKDIIITLKINDEIIDIDTIYCNDVDYIMGAKIIYNKMMEEFVKNMMNTNNYDQNKYNNKTPKQERNKMFN
ncbi:MAG: hypothetical protein ACOCP8_06695 [archaeon]